MAESPNPLGKVEAGAMRLWELIRYAFENLFRARLRTMLTTLGVSIACGALVSMVAFALGLQSQIEAPFQKLGLLNNIEVRLKSADDAKSSAPPPVLDDEALAKLEKLPGAASVYPDFRLSEIEVSHQRKKKRTYALGLPREAGLLPYWGDLMIAGEYFSLQKRPQAILAEGLLKELGFAQPEDALNVTLQVASSGLVSTGESQFAMRRREFSVQVVGVYRPPSFATRFGADALLLPVDMMRDLPGAMVEPSLRNLRRQQDPTRIGYASVVVRARRVGDVLSLEKEIQALGFQTRSAASQLKEARTFFVFMEVLLASVGTVGLVVAGLGIANTLLMTVVERRQEIGVYKAIGASDGDVRTLFLTEAAAIGFVGGLGGLVLAAIVCAILQWAVNKYASGQGAPTPLDVFSFPFWLLSGAVFFAICVSVLSGFYPAARAARIDPIQALRRE